MRKEDLIAEQQELKSIRQARINAGLLATELDNIKENKKSHGKLYTGIKAMRILNLYSLKIYGEVPNTNGRPIIFAPNHVRKQDIEIIMEAIPNHMFLLSGDFENVHGTLSGSMLEKNGIIYLDMEDHKDRKNVKHVIKDILDNNVNLLWFYEASWNLSPNKLYYDGYFYMVQAAVDSNAIVLPVSFDLIGRKACVNIGKPIDFRKEYGVKKLTNEEKKAGLCEIKEQIGSGLYDMWDKYSHEERKNIPNDYWEKYKEKVLKEWKFDEADINRKHFVDSRIVEQKDAYDHLNKLDVNKNNAFLLSKRNHQ